MDRETGFPLINDPLGTVMRVENVNRNVKMADSEFLQCSQIQVYLHSLLNAVPCHSGIHDILSLTFAPPEVEYLIRSIAQISSVEN